MLTKPNDYQYIAIKISISVLYIYWKESDLNVS